MFIYILNLINDGAKKEAKQGISTIKIIDDVKNIIELTNIRDNISFDIFCDKIVNVFKILNGYNISNKYIRDILDKFMVNKINEKRINKSEENDLNIKIKFELDFIIDIILENNKYELLLREKLKEIKMVNTNNVVKEFKDIKYNKSYSIENKNNHNNLQIRNRRRILDFTEKIKVAGYYIPNNHKFIW